MRCRGKGLSHASELNRGVRACQRRDLEEEYTVYRRDRKVPAKAKAEAKSVRASLSSDLSLPRAAHCVELCSFGVFLYKNDCARYRFTTTVLPVPRSLMGCCRALCGNANTLLVLYQSRRCLHRLLSPPHRPSTIRSHYCRGAAHLSGRLRPSAIFSDRYPAARIAEAEDRTRV